MCSNKIPRPPSNTATKQPAKKEIKSAHLITDEGFFRRFIINLAAILCIISAFYIIHPLRHVAVESYGRINDEMMATAHRLAWWSLLGLLSSSCCALQILLNLLSFGCAGFNTVLGPLRPTFLALTFTVQLSAWSVAYYRPWQWAPTAVSTILSLFLTFLPEVLAYRTACWQHHAKTRVDRKIAIEDGSNLEVLYVQLDSMGCASCVATVSSVIEKIPGVFKYDVSLETGIAEIWLKNGDGKQTGEERKTQVETICTKLNDAGFPAESLDEQPTSSHRLPEGTKKIQ